VRSALRSAVVGSARACRAFLLGDAPELLVTVLAVVGAAYALQPYRVAAVVILPLLAAAGLGFGVWRAARSRARS
jgi:hypothetical protein